MAVPAWLRIWLLVKLTISDAMSVSRIRDSAADRFSTATPRLATVCSRRFWTAPRLDRAVETVAMAASMVAMAESAPEVVDTLTALTPRAVELTALIVAEIWFV